MKKSLQKSKKLTATQGPEPMNPKILLVFFIILAIAVVLFSVYSSIHDIKITATSEVTSCKNGESRVCTYNSCSGVSTCINGIWGGCNWQRICNPGTIVPCLQNGCATSSKACNECGTGYGNCQTP